MPTIDGAAAAQTLLGYAPLSKRGACLYYVWLAMKAHGATSSTTYPTAYSAWEATTRRHTDKNPPDGATVYFGRRRSDGNMDGDITVALGGRLVATDYPSWGGVGTPTIDERAAQTDRDYLGWSEDFIGNTTVVIAVPTDVNAPLVVDGVWGPATTSKLQSQLGVTVDGALGPVTIEALQAALGVTQDGQIGPVTTKALQARVGATQDGILGPETVKALQAYLNAGGFASTPVVTPGVLTVDGVWGDATTRAFQANLGVTVDGSLGPVTWKAFQTVTGITVDGVPGPQTYKELQANVGAVEDGVLGPETVKALQTFLNAGKKFAPVQVDVPPVIPPVNPTNVDNPRGLPTYTPVYPGAKFGLVAPLGDGVRGFEGDPPVAVPVIIDRFIIHHTDTPGVDQLDYFSYKNDRSSCPTWYLRTDGVAFELIPPHMKPCSTGPEWNWRSVAVEVLDVDASFTVSDAQLEWLAQVIAWLAGFDGQELDGTPVDFKIDSTHVLGHRDCVGTDCPGDFLYGKIPSIIDRAQTIYEAAHTPPVDTYTLPRDVVDALVAAVDAAKAAAQ